MKYLRCSRVLVSLELVIVAWRMPVLVKPEPRPDESRVQILGSVGRLRALRIGDGTGDMVVVIWIIRGVLKKIKAWILGLDERCQHEYSKGASK